MSIDLPPVPPPPMPRPRLNKPTTILLGCGLGIGAVLVFAVAGIVLAMVVLPSRIVPKARIFVDGVYAKAEANKNLTAEQLKVYGELKTFVTAENSGVFAVNIAGATLYAHLKDGAISVDEIAEAEGVRDAVAKDPTGGVLTMMTYVNAHPDMQKRINEFTRDLTIATAGVK